MTTNETSDPAAVIGYDPGFENTKVCVNGRVGMIQSAASPVQEKALDAPLKALDLLPPALRRQPIAYADDIIRLRAHAHYFFRHLHTDMIIPLAAFGSNRLIWTASEAQTLRWP